MPEIVNWYLESLTTFWGSALRIGLPQIILLALLVCWLRRKCCERSCWGMAGRYCCNPDACCTPDRSCRRSCPPCPEPGCEPSCGRSEEHEDAHAEAVGDE